MRNEEKFLISRTKFTPLVLSLGSKEYLLKNLLISAGSIVYRINVLEFVVV